MKLSEIIVTEGMYAITDQAGNILKNNLTSAQVKQISANPGNLSKHGKLKVIFDPEFENDPIFKRQALVNYNNNEEDDMIVKKQAL